MTSDPLIGKTLSGKYELLEKIGSGAMGTVYRAEHTTLKKRVALKVLHPDLYLSEETLRRFQQEGIAAGRIKHPNAIEIFDFDKTDEGLVYLALEFVEGKSLKKVLLEEGALPLADAIFITREILRGLAAAHAVGIVHRDLKPENIMVQEKDGGSFQVKVLDFGISKLVESNAEDAMMTQTGRIMGTPQYMAPEQCGGAVVDHRADLYSLGLILFEMAAGEPPFQGASVTEILMKHTTEESPSLRAVNRDLTVPRDVERILAKLLAKKATDRFESAREVIEAIDAIDYDRPAKGRVVVPGGSGSSPAKRIALIAAAVAVLAVAGWFGWSALNGNDGDTNGSGSTAAADPAPTPPKPSTKDTPDVSRVRQKDTAARTARESEYIEHLDSARRSLRLRDPDSLRAARNELDLAMALPCRDAEAYVLRGDLYLARGDDAAARLDYEEAIRLDDEYAEAESRLGRVLRSRGDSAEALVHFRRATAIDPSFGLAHEGIGLALYDLGEYPEAREALERAVDLDPTLARSYHCLGRLDLRIGDFDAAKIAFTNAKRQDDRFVAAYEDLGRVYDELDDWKEAEEVYRDAIQYAEATPRILTALGANLIAQERITDAKPFLEDALRKDPEIGRAHILMGVVLESEGDVDGAIRSLETGIARSADEADAMILLGSLYQQRGRNETARDQYVTALGIDDTLVPAITSLALLDIDEGRYGDAVARLEEVVELAPDNRFAHFALGGLLKDYFDDIEGARTYLSRYRQLGGDDPRVLAWLDANR